MTQITKWPTLIMITDFNAKWGTIQIRNLVIEYISMKAMTTSTHNVFHRKYLYRSPRFMVKYNILLDIKLVTPTYIAV